MEIRRVPPDWEHPQDRDGEYLPMYGVSYEAACEEWLSNLTAWENGSHPDRAESETRYYWDWEAPPPDSLSYFPKFDSPATAYQVYEATTEGTPISPVFVAEADVLKWLLAEGVVAAHAEELIRRGGMATTYVSLENGELGEEYVFYDV